MRGGESYDWGPPDDVVTEPLLADVFRVDASVDRPTRRTQPSARRVMAVSDAVSHRRR
jgi:ABC-type cobalamin/Fe3+-siderophores transport system ATPase subunit